MVSHAGPARRRAAGRLAAGASPARVSVLYIPYVFHDLAFRVGNPEPIDVVMGTILFVMLLEATRRAMGWPLPLIAIGFMVYALSGRSFPGMLEARGRDAGTAWSTTSISPARASTASRSAWSRPTSSTSCCSACMATRIGLGQLFLDIASSIAGRYAGGPAKVSVFGSAHVRHDVRLVGRQHRDGRLAHHSRDDPRRLSRAISPAAVEAAAVHRRPDHAADHGRGGVPDGRVPRTSRTRPSSPRRSCRRSCISSACSCQVHFEAKSYGLRGLTARRDAGRCARSLAAATGRPRCRCVLLIGSCSRAHALSGRVHGASPCCIVGLTTRISGNRRELGAVRRVARAAGADRLRRLRRC